MPNPQQTFTQKEFWRKIVQQMALPGLVLIALGFLEIFISISIPFLIGVLYQSAIKTVDIQLGKQLLVILVFMVIVSSISNCMVRTLNSHVRGKVIRNIRNSTFMIYSGAKFQDLQKKDSGEIIQRILGESEFVGNVYSRYGGVLHNCIILAVVYAILLAYNVKIALASLATVILFACWNYAWKIPLTHVNESLGKGTGGLYQYSFNFFNGIKQIKAYNMSRHYVALVRRDLAIIKRDMFRRDAINSILMQGGALQYSIMMVLLLIIGVLGMKNGSFSLSGYIVLSGLLGFTAKPVMEISDFFSSLQVAKTAKDRLKMVFELEQEGKSGTLDPGTGDDIEIKELDFRYPGAGSDVLRKLNLQIQKGAAVAIVGESGSGKSTLVNVLLRLFEHSEGGIFLGSTDIRHFDLEKYRRKIGYVTQSITLFDTTFRENIDLEGRFPEDEVLEACKLANLTSLLAKLPMGLGSKVGDRGALISGGEKQRIALARALCNRPSILILDEPTSALDSETQSAILDSLALLRLMRPEMTQIIISHDLKMVMSCDKIFLMAKGTVVNEGSHETLLADEPAYRDLFQVAQAGLSYPHD